MEAQRERRNAIIGSLSYLGIMLSMCQYIFMINHPMAIQFQILKAAVILINCINSVIDFLDGGSGRN